MLEEAKMSPYFLLGVISGTFGIVAYGTLESGSGYEIEVDIYLFLVGIEIYLREGPWIVYIQRSSEKVFVHLIFISFCDDSIVGVGVLKYPYKTAKSRFNSAGIYYLCYPGNDDLKIFDQLFGYL